MVLLENGVKQNRKPAKLHTRKPARNPRMALPNISSGPGKVALNWLVKKDTKYHRELKKKLWPSPALRKPYGMSFLR